MSFFDDASLVFLPSGQAGKDGKAYSMKPTNGDGDFTFSRGSNLTATRVDSNGLIEKGRENLLKQSNQFDTTWLKTNVSVTSGQSGYDGSTDAWKIEASTSSTTTITQAASISGVMTASIYAKEGTTNWFRFSINDSGVNTRAYFDLSGSGAVGSTAGNIIDTKIESVGNGYFRCSITFNATAANLLLFLADANSSISPSAGDYIYIQDAQLEIGLTSTEYIESGATTGLAGILEDSPRFDYSGGASCPSLLLEPSRTNLIEQSEYFDSWSSVDTTISLSTITSPEGLQNAYLMPITGSSSRVQILPSFGSGTYSLSVYAKSDSNATIRLLVIADGSVQQQYFTTTNDWDRYVFTFTASTSLTQIQIRSGQTDADNIYIFGAQLEQGSYPTSYIPNHSGGSVTREADSAEVTSASSIIGQTEGTIFLEFKADNVSLDIIGINRSLTNGILIFKTASNLIRAQIYSGGSSTTLTNTGVLSGVIKLALVYKSRESSLFINGTKVATSTNNISFTASLNLVEFMGNYFAGIGKNEVQQTLLFPTALSDNNCITLTS